MIAKCWDFPLKIGAELKRRFGMSRKSIKCRSLLKRSDEDLKYGDGLGLGELAPDVEHEDGGDE